MSGLGWKEKNVKEENKTGPHAAPESFRECDVNVRLIKLEAVPVTHTLLWRLLSPHALLHSGGSASGSDHGTRIHRGKKGAPAPSLRHQTGTEALRPFLSCFPTVCRVAVEVGSLEG